MQYRQLICRSFYEETRLILSEEGYRQISDGIVEAYYTLTRYKLEQKYQRLLTDHEFKDVVEFTHRHQSYAKTINKNYDYNTIVEHMLKNGYYVPSLIVDDVKSQQNKELKIKDFIKSLLHSYPYTQDGLNMMYGEYRTWYHENFPNQRSFARKDFKETLRRLRQEPEK